MEGTRQVSRGSSGASVGMRAGHCQGLSALAPVAKVHGAGLAAVQQRAGQLQAGRECASARARVCVCMHVMATGGRAVCYS